MKVGILTFHRADNYGSALQAFALSKVLEKLKHEPEIVDFIYEKDLEQYKYFRTHLYKTRKKQFLQIFSIYIEIKCARKILKDLGWII
ncbi:hypothetical protein FZ990_14870 [Clostridium perfringens]|nr:hypothetical protein [Clostridium perfringens]